MAESLMLTAAPWSDDPVITADDVIRAGACTSGVARKVQRLADKIAAAMPVSEVKKLLAKDEQGYADRAVMLDGDGYGDGDGDGYGYGYGYGYGDGYGYGYGDGYGYGYGDGDGYGDRTGDGYAYSR